MKKLLRVFLPLFLFVVVLISMFLFNNSKAAMTLNIANYNEFLDFANALNDTADSYHDDYRTADVKLKADIDIPMSILKWTPIGIRMPNNPSYYSYSFDGEGHDINFQGGDYTESEFNQTNLISDNTRSHSVGLFGRLGTSGSPNNSTFKNFNLNIPTSTLDLDYARGGSINNIPNEFAFLAYMTQNVDISDINVSVDLNIIYGSNPASFSNISCNLSSSFSSANINNINVVGNGITFDNSSGKTGFTCSLLSRDMSTCTVSDITIDAKSLKIINENSGLVAAVCDTGYGPLNLTSVVNNAEIRILSHNGVNNGNAVGGIAAYQFGACTYDDITNNGDIILDNYKGSVINVGGIVGLFNKVSGPQQFLNIVNNGDIKANCSYYFDAMARPSNLALAGINGNCNVQYTWQLTFDSIYYNVKNYGDVDITATLIDPYNLIESGGNFTYGTAKYSAPAILASGLISILMGNTSSQEKLYNYGDVSVDYKESNLGANLTVARATGVINQIAYMGPDAMISDAYNFGDITSSTESNNNVFASGIFASLARTLAYGTQYNFIVLDKLFNKGDVTAKRSGPTLNSNTTLATGLIIYQPQYSKITNSGNIGKIEGETCAAGLVGLYANDININTFSQSEKHPYIENSYNQGDIYLKPSFNYTNKALYMGGISANTYALNLENVYNRGNLYFQPSVDQSTTELYAGGIAGNAEFYGAEDDNYITNVYNRGSIYIDDKGSLAQLFVGGIAGILYDYMNVENIYNSGNIYASMSATSATLVGGIFGFIKTETFTSNINLGELNITKALSLGDDINTANASGSTSYYVNRVLGYVFAGTNAGTNDFSGLRGLVSVKNNGTPFSTGGALDDTVPLGADIPLSDKQVESFYTGQGFNGTGNNWETDNIEDDLADYRFPYLKNLDELIETISNSGIYVGEYQVNILSGPSVEEYEIVYMPNSGSGTMANTLATKDAIVTLSSVTFTYGGRNFLYWSTSPTDASTGTTFNDGEEFTYTYSSNLTLYAIWEFLTYTIYYENNLGSGTMASTPAKDLTNVTLRACTFTKDGYTFDYWNTAYDGSGNSFADKYVFKPYTLMQDLTLYAIWKTKPAVVNPVNPTKTYKIIFNGNGAKGTMKALSVKAGSKLTLPKNKFTMSGQRFVSWNTKKDGTGTSYSNMYTFSSYNVNKNLILYAIFKKIGSADKIITLKPDNSTGVFTTAAFTKPKNLVFMLTMFTLLVLGIATIISLKREKIEEIQKNIEYIDGEFFTYY